MSINKSSFNRVEGGFTIMQYKCYSTDPGCRSFALRYFIYILL